MVVGKLSWTKFFFIGCLFLLLFTVNLAAQKQSPKIAFDKTSIDLGQIAPGEKAAGVFIVSNKGSDTLKIQRVAPT